MAIAVPLGTGNVTSRAATTATNTITGILPANAKVGDVLIATVASDYAGPVTTTTAGWVRVSSPRTGSMREVAVFHAFAVGSLPAAPVFIQNGTTAARQTVGIFRVTGASQTELPTAVSGYAATADSANTTGLVIPSTGAAAGGATFAVAYNNTNAAQGATTGAQFDNVAADLQINSYGTGAAGSSSATSQAVRVSTASVGPFALTWGKTVANSQGTAVTIPAAGGGGSVPDEPEVPPEPEHDDEPGVAIQVGTNNVTTAAENADGTNSITVPIPTRVRNGDVLICAVTHSESAALSFPSGWTLLSTPRTGSNRWLAVYGFPVVNSNPTPPVFTAAGSVTDLRMSAVMFRLTGVGATDYLASTSEWQATDAGANRTEFSIPAAPSAGTSLVVVYNNTSAGVTQSHAAVAGATLVGSAGKTVAGRATTTLDLIRATGAGAKTVTLSPAAANAAGFQLTFQPKQAAVPATWEARVFQGGQLRNATVAAVRSGSSFVRPGVVSWQPKDYTLNDLFSTNPFFIAHRGSGDNWPEHTMTSYTNAAAYGVKALEVSVSATKDGILICHHDLNFTKTAGDPRKVADMTYAEIQAEIKIDSRAWTGLATPLVSPPLAKDVIDAYIDTHVIFIEDKAGTAATTLLNLMDTYPRGKEKFVWKQWAGANQWQAAKDRGYKLWGYFLADIFARIPELAPNFDFLGIPHTASDQVISETVAIANDMGIPVICWEIHYRYMIDRVRALGVKGLMTSNIPYLMTAQGTAQATRDTFATGLRAAGDMPHTTDGSWTVQPQIDPAGGGVLRYVLPGSGSYVMGSMCPLPWDRYAIEFEMRWPKLLPGAQLHAGVWFGHGTDITHRTGVASSEGGYHLIQRVNGVFDLYRHDPGSTGGIPLATATATPPVVGQWMKFRVEVTPEGMTAARVGTGEPTLTATDTLYRGKYFGLQKNFTMKADEPETPLEYRNVIVSPLP